MILFFRVNDSAFLHFLIFLSLLYSFGLVCWRIKSTIFIHINQALILWLNLSLPHFCFTLLNITIVNKYILFKSSYKNVLQISIYIFKIVNRPLFMNPATGLVIMLDFMMIYVDLINLQYGMKL